MPTHSERINNFVRSTTNHTPSAEAVEKIEKVRLYAQDLAATVINNTEHSREASLAVTHLEDAVMWAVKALVLQDQND